MSEMEEWGTKANAIYMLWLFNSFTQVKNIN